ncbi:MAG: phosphoglucomutase/phosphomannomutase PgmG [Bdellovibrionales bacterium]
MTTYTQKPHKFNPTILREYDIRGIVDENVTADDAFAIGCAFGTMVKRRAKDDRPQTVAVGYDGRETSPIYADAVTQGLMSTGVNVTWIGLGPSPMLYFAVKSRKEDAGIMITGSHNPSNYNGFKMSFLNEAVYGDRVQEVGRIAQSADYEQGNGSKTEIDVSEDYLNRILSDLDTDKEFNIVWDNGNGAAGNLLKRLTDKIPGKHHLLYEEVDANFPNHHPDPTVDKNLQDLIKKVAEESADFGIAFDGDADRIGVVNNKGDILRCDVLMAIYAKDVLKAQPNAPIVGDIKCSKVMFDEINALGGQAVMWKTGHSLIKTKMLELNAPLAGELSGHIFFADKYYGYDDALYCSVRLINAIAHSGKTLAEMTAHMPQLYSTPEIRFEVDEATKFDSVTALVQNVKDTATDGIDVNDTDGVRVSTEDGWWLVRASNTQNALSARAEATSPEGLERLKEMIQTHVKKIGYTVPF